MRQLFRAMVERTVVALATEAPAGRVTEPVEGPFDVADLALSGSFALVGPPGVGKSHLLAAALTRRLGIDAEKVRRSRHWISLVEISTKTELEAALTAAMTPPASPPVVVLDGVDECPLPRASRVLARALEDIASTVGAEGLDVWVGCRSADYSPVLAGHLADAVGTFSRFQLELLRDAEVRQLVSGEGLDPDAFLRAVRTAGAEPLVQVPLSLYALIRQYDQTGALHGAPTDVFRAAARELLTEWDPERRDDAPAGITPDQRLALAERCCFHLLLSGRSGLSTRPDGASDASTLDITAIAGDREFVRPGEPFEPDLKGFAEVLDTACFETRGAGRVGPAHASLGSFLAAAYVDRRGLPYEQLRSLLVVDDPVGGTGVPAHLREMCAWLVALDPELHGWLIDVDPQSLVPVAAVIDDDRLADQLARHLLEQPEAALRAHGFRAWRLRSHTLGDLLTATLAELGPPPYEGPELSVVQVVAHIVDDSGIAAMAGPLAELGCDSRLPAPLRSRFIAIASRLDRAAAADAVASLGEDVSAAPASETDDDVRGALAEALWPERMPTAHFLELLSPQRSRPHSAATYDSVRLGLADALRDEDLSVALPWAVDRVAEGGDLIETSDVTYVVSSLLGRATGSPLAYALLDDLATLVAAALGAHRELRLPAHFELDPSVEPIEIADLRRALAVRVVQVSGSDRYGAYQVSHGWESSWSRIWNLSGRARPAVVRSGLIGPDDVPALAELAATGTPSLGTLLGLLFDPERADHREAAWALYETDARSELAAWFDSRPIDDEQSRWARREAERGRREQARDTEEASRRAELAERQPVDGNGFRDLLLELLDTPAAAPLRGDDSVLTVAARCGAEGIGRDLWVEGALAYLRDVDPESEEHLDRAGGSSQEHLAAYLALDLLHRHSELALLERLPDDRLDAWAACLFGAPPSVAGTMSTRATMLRRLHASRPERVVALLTRSLDAHVAQQRRCSLLRDLATPDLADLGPLLDLYLDAVLARVEQQAGSSAAPTATVSVAGLDAVIAPDDRGLIELAHDLIWTLTRWSDAVFDDRVLPLIECAARAAPHDPVVRVAATVAAALLSEDGTLWARLQPVVAASPTLERTVLSLIATSSGPSLLTGLASTELAALWNRLATHWPPEDDELVLGVHQMSVDEQVQQWRDRVLRELETRGSAEAVTALRELLEIRPGHRHLVAALERTSERLRSESWSPVDSDQLRRVVRKNSARVVQSPEDLLRVVAEGLRALAPRLIQSGSLFWNKDRSGATRPKDESEFAGWCADELRRHLGGFNVVVNREVQVRPTTTRGQGRAVDFQVDATVPGQAAALSCRVLVEVKGNWHGELYTAMDSQLVREYLAPIGDRHGVYLIAWFPVDQWTDENDSRKKVARRRDRVNTETQLRKQAAALEGFEIDVVVLDVPFPAADLPPL